MNFVQKLNSLYICHITSCGISWKSCCISSRVAQSSTYLFMSNNVFNLCVSLNESSIHFFISIMFLSLPIYSLLTGAGLSFMACCVNWFVFSNIHKTSKVSTFFLGADWFGLIQKSVTELCILCWGAIDCICWGCIGVCTWLYIGCPHWLPIR